MNYPNRVESVKRSLESENIDALLVTNLTNVNYLTGFSGTNGQVLVTRDEVMFLTDGRYAARAAQLVQGAEIEIYSGKPSDRLPALLERGSVKRLGIEAQTVTLSSAREIEDGLKDFEVVPTTGLVEDLRRTKDDNELDRIRRAVAITDEVFGLVLQELAVDREEREIGLWLEIQMRERGADAVSFEPVVGSGPQSAHIHHSPTDRQFEKGDFILLDFGCKVDGYCSDMTRTVVLGPASDVQQETYALVLETQLRGIEAVAAGRGGADIDAQARQVIESAGRSDEFGHGLGHGVGLEVHEAPRLHRRSQDTLRARDLVTIEPGLYTRGLGGVRIEDDVVVTDSGAEVLTSAPKDELLEV